MTRSVRTLARVVGAVAVAVALTGCVKATADTTFGEDETFSQRAVVAYEDSVADDLTERLGFDVDSVVEGLDESPEFLALQEEYPGQIELADYDDGELEGLELTLTDMPIDAFAEASDEVLGTVGASASVELVDGMYIVSVTQSSDDALALLAVGPSQLELVESAVDVHATFTFPGPVREATAGEISGNTVSLGIADLATTPEIRIVADAQGSIPWGTILTWVAVIAGFAIIIGGATALVIQDRRASRRNALPDPTTDPDASGPGMLSATAATPEEPPAPR
ncbi:LppM family (lipo)protein [Demequina flava]|uniref:LppM family (lipo)protein n=1 Tax=Demequina flava TaxID=1095025 RepID=UPI000785508A|nr:hypothetical protein [Demequina flava]